MFVTAYQWRIKPGKEPQFISAWTQLTRSLQSSVPELSAKLHRTLDGRLVGLVEWPSQEKWESQASKKIDISLQNEMMTWVEEVDGLWVMETLQVITPTSSVP